MSLLYRITTAPTSGSQVGHCVRGTGHGDTLRTHPSPPPPRVWERNLNPGAPTTLSPTLSPTPQGEPSFLAKHRNPRYHSPTKSCLHLWLLVHHALRPRLSLTDASMAVVWATKKPAVSGTQVVYWGLGCVLRPSVGRGGLRQHRVSSVQSTGTEDTPRASTVTVSPAHSLGEEHPPSASKTQN